MAFKKVKLEKKYTVSPPSVGFVSWGCNPLWIKNIFKNFCKVP